MLLLSVEIGLMIFQQRPLVSCRTPLDPIRRPANSLMSLWSPGKLLGSCTLCYQPIKKAKTH